MAKQGVWDFAGGIVIHVTAGFSALATVVALPSRHHLDASVENKPHNVPDTYAKGLDVSIHGHEAYFDGSNDGTKKTTIGV